MKNIVMVCYPKWAGGKFLINCLGLSSGATLQHRQLALMDLRGDLDPGRKLQILQQRLWLEPKYQHWQDLKLGDIRTLSDLRSCPEAIAAGKLFLRTSHEWQDYQEFYHDYHDYIFTNIVLVNENAFINHRLGLPVSFDRSPYSDLSQNWSHDQRQFYHDIADVFWDTAWYLDRDQFLDRMQWLYDVCGLDDFDADLVDEFRDNYMAVIEILAQRAIQEQQ